MIIIRFFQFFHSSSSSRNVASLLLLKRDNVETLFFFFKSSRRLQFSRLQFLPLILSITQLAQTICIRLARKGIGSRIPRFLLLLLLLSTQFRGRGSLEKEISLFRRAQFSSIGTAPLSEEYQSTCASLLAFQPLVRSALFIDHRAGISFLVSSRRKSSENLRMFSFSFR